MTSSDTAGIDSEAPKMDGRKARRIETRRKILDAASELFAKHGYGGTSLDEIAAHAGVSKGSIFYNFATKDDLFENLISSELQRLADHLNEARKGRTSWDAYDEVTLRIAREIEADPAPAQVVINELFRTDRPWDDSLRKARAALVTPMMEILVEIHEATNPDDPIAIEPEFQELWHNRLETMAMWTLFGLILATVDSKAFHPERPVEEVQRSVLVSLQRYGAV